MIVPSIDILGGEVVQLVGGDPTNIKVKAGDPKPLAEKFGIVGEIAIVDLDAALGTGSNEALIKSLLKVAPCRIGGGIRTAQKGIDWLNAGATKIILGTAATPEVLSMLPKNRVIAALDALNGEVVVEGWKKKTGKTVFERIEELKPFVSGFLVTFVELEGTMKGIDMKKIEKLVSAVGKKHELTIAGGVTTKEEVQNIVRSGANAQVGMALYTGVLDLGEALASIIVSDRPDGLFPTVVVNVHNQALGFVYSSKESIAKAIEIQSGVYWSRKRGLWIKGLTSGATQKLIRIKMDCDRDCLCFVVEQTDPGFCHLERMSCFGQGSGLPALMNTIESRKKNAPVGSYTKRLFDDPKLLDAKILEEANELIDATEHENMIGEAADVIYFTLVKCAKNNISLLDVEKELDRRARKVSRRKGDAKEHIVKQLEAHRKEQEKKNSQ